MTKILLLIIISILISRPLQANEAMDKLQGLVEAGVVAPNDLEKTQIDHANTSDNEKRLERQMRGVASTLKQNLELEFVNSPLEISVDHYKLPE